MCRNKLVLKIFTELAGGEWVRRNFRQLLSLGCYSPLRNVGPKPEKAYLSHGNDADYIKQFKNISCYYYHPKSATIM
jgi:hypothetical protein